MRWKHLYLSEPKRIKDKQGWERRKGATKLGFFQGKKKKKSNLCLNYSTFLGICLFAEREQVWE